MLFWILVRVRTFPPSLFVREKRFLTKEKSKKHHLTLLQSTYFSKQLHRVSFVRSINLLSNLSFGFPVYQNCKMPASESTRVIIFLTISIFFRRYVAADESYITRCNLRFELILDFEEYFQYKDCNVKLLKHCLAGLSLVFYEYPPYIFCSQNDCQKPNGLLAGEFKSFFVVQVNQKLLFISIFLFNNASLPNARK